MAASRPSLARPVTPPLILAADDDLLARRLISHKLSRDGYEVVTFGNGEELLAGGAKTRPALIILDLMMPIKDGYSTLRELKADAGLRAVPVLMLSAKNHEEDIVRCLKTGAADYMVKPFSPDELVARVRKLISGTAVAPKS